jgi:hypothetical protein
MASRSLKDAWREKAWDSFDEETLTQYYGYGIYWPAIDEAVTLMKNRDSWIQNWLKGGPVHLPNDVKNHVTRNWIYKCPSTRQFYTYLERAGKPFEISMILNGLFMGLETMLAPVFFVYENIAMLYQFLTDNMPARLRAFAELGLSIVIAKVTSGFIGYTGLDKKNKMVALLNGMAKSALRKDFEDRGLQITEKDEYEFINQHDVEVGELLEGFDQSVDDRTKLILASIHDQVVESNISPLAYQLVKYPEITKQQAEIYIAENVKTSQPMSPSTVGLGVVAAALAYKLFTR